MRTFTMNVTIDKEFLQQRAIVMELFNASVSRKDNALSEHLMGVEYLLSRIADEYDASTGKTDAHFKFNAKGEPKGKSAKVFDRAKLLVDKLVGLPEHHRPTEVEEK